MGGTVARVSVDRVRVIARTAKIRITGAITHPAPRAGRVLAVIIAVLG